MATPASLYDTIHKNNAPTFQSLNAQKQSKEKDRKTIQKVDRTVPQRLITAFQAGRSVDLDEVMQHELMDVPLTLATVEGKLRTGTMATWLLAEGIPVPDNIEHSKPTSALIVDGAASSQGVISKMPKDATTFGDLADAFNRHIRSQAKYFSRVDVVFVGRTITEGQYTECAPRYLGPNSSHDYR